MGETREREVRLQEKVSELQAGLREVQHCLAEVEQERDKVTAKLSISLKDLLDANEDKIKLRSVDQNEIQSLETNVERLVRERENLGAVNLRAEIEIDELKSKLLEMQNEKEDLSLAIKKLENIF